MAKKFPELPGWSFDADEVSAGVFMTVGSDRFGRKIQKTGTDPDSLIEACRQDVIRMMEDYDARNEGTKLD